MVIKLSFSVFTDFCFFIPQKSITFVKKTGAMYDKIEILDNGNDRIYRIADRNSELAYISVERILDIPVVNQEPWRKMHSHSFYFLIWFFKGCGSHIIDFKEYSVEANKVFFISPNQLHLCKDLQDFDGIVVTFSTDFLNNVNRDVKELIRQKLFSSTQNTPPVCKIEDCGIEYIKKDIKRIEDGIANYKDCFTKKYYLAASLTQFMLDLLTYGEKEKTLLENKSRDFKIYLRFMDAVEDAFRQLHNAKDYVGEVEVSLNTLKKCVKNVSGKSPSLLINERIATEAKRMLYERTNMRVGEIADALGFEDNSNFIKFFRRYVGMTPIAFREQF